MPSPEKQRTSCQQPITESLLVYEYTCCCGHTYVGKTIQRFSERIRQHVPKKLLAEEPVLESARSDFCTKLDECEAEGNIEGTYMCSFDVTSLLTLKICMDTLYRDESVKKPSIPEALLEKLLVKATTEVEFSFGGIMYRQLVGVAKGSPLGPVLANVFVGHCESKISPADWPLFYARYVDDTFAMFSVEDEAAPFLETLQGLHESLTFTVEQEQDNQLPFMDVAVSRHDDHLIRSVYRKPTFTGLYTRWDSFKCAWWSTLVVKPAGSNKTSPLSFFACCAKARRPVVSSTLSGAVDLALFHFILYILYIYIYNAHVRACLW